MGTPLVRAQIIVYDLAKDVRFTVTPEWDRSAGQLAVSYLSPDSSNTIAPITAPARSFRCLVTAYFSQPKIQPMLNCSGSRFLPLPLRLT